MTVSAPFLGMVLLDKPGGMSSQRAMQKVRRLLGLKKAGNVGTLDPMATGMLPIALGRATKLVDYFHDYPKTYTATIQLGQQTDTGDAEGEVIKQVPIPEVTPQQLAAVEKQFTGSISQVPPMYSAIKQNGQTLYHLARKGITVERPSREVFIHQLALQSQGDQCELRVVCSKGTYVRTLAEDIAAALGSLGHLVQLRRLACAGFLESQMLTLEQFEQQLQAHKTPWLASDQLLLDWPALAISEPQFQALYQGRDISLDGSHDGWVRLFYQGQLTAIADIHHDTIHKRVWLG